MMCSVLAIILVLTPAAYHRRAEPGQDSRRLVRVGTWCLGLSMIPLMVGTSLDVYVVARMVTESPAVSLALGIVSLACFGLCWFAFPWVKRSKG